ncbi:MAG TPA: ankyrin repeat domain-containing protein, partial [Candidatus Babeliaceae bacterium]|nr:ankyrin repeat domain-containing protein [Candidatus Babeliaceae bacterium]
EQRDRLDAALIAKIEEQSNNKQEVEQLILQGANVNARNSDGDTVLSEAIYNGLPEIAKLLIEKGANPNEYTGSFQNTFPIFSALDKKDIHTLLALLQAGANPNVTEYESESTPLDYLLGKYGMSKEFSISGIKALVLYGGFPCQYASSFNRLAEGLFPEPLLQAIALKDIGRIKALLSSDYDQGITKDSNGISALVYAAGQGNEQILKLLLSSSYKYDTPGIEKGFEVVENRLLGLEHDSLEYKQYKVVYKKLIQQHGDGIASTVLTA